jgi:hypothetical protein
MTMDRDLLVVGRDCLRESVWEPVRASGADVTIRIGDYFDPLTGVVRVEEEGETPVDVVVMGGNWQRRILERAIPARVQDAATRVVTVPDLVLLKLHAGSRFDVSDIHLLLEGDDAPEIIAAVERELPALPEECAALWRKIRAE